MKTNYSSTSSYRWLILLIGVLAQIAFAIGFAGIPTTAVIMRAEYHFSMSQLGFVLGCMGLGVAISEIIWGMLTDKLGDKVVLIIGLVSMGATYLIICLGFVPKDDTYPSYLSLGILLIIAGAVGGSINSSSGRAVMTWFKDSERGFAMSIRQTAIPVGAAIGSLLVPYLASVYGFGRVFLILAVICFIVAICVWIWLVELEMPKSPAGTITQGEVKSPFKRWTAWKVAIAGAALTFPQMSVLTFSSVFLADHHHLDITTIAIVNFFINLGGGCLRIITGIITDKHKNRRKVISITAIIAGIAGVALGLAFDQNVYIVVSLLIIVGLAGNAWHGIGYTEIAVTAGVQYAGTALGMLGMTVFAVSFIIPYVIPFILNLSSWGGVWIVVGIASFIASPLMKEFVKKPINKSINREKVSNG
ncbi:MULTISPECIES: MFS transporter [Bacillus cereus group]|uniref:MFS transporter n=1 Tax=Bacillus cereus group TaxID=86661 RepID=UPI000BF9C614|nr:MULTISPECIES: MFS transporter [Bacillus cereus group]MBY0018465.1 MFS transporter [Bacillus cereus]PEY81758.1 MFS transporter [Bacillus thuringiensis]PFD38587.1 MFS transporter [Bacillus thuringiensis]PFE60505.1 MFS transporter [Bacillus thuringiensis]PFI31127.1 MFS transporter [Bacillus thuringiensis]